MEKQIMGRRAAQRRRRAKLRPRIAGRSSDPEYGGVNGGVHRSRSGMPGQYHITNGDGGEDGRDHSETAADTGWDSLDEQALLLDGYAAVAKGDPSRRPHRWLLDEMDMTRRLSSLNVSPAVTQVSGGGTTVTGTMELLPAEASIATTSDVETEQQQQQLVKSNMYSPEDLQHRYSRKRISRRNKKRTKKAKVEDNMAAATATATAVIDHHNSSCTSYSKLRHGNVLSSHVSKVNHPAAISSSCWSGKQLLTAAVLTDDSQTGLTGHLPGGVSDTSSRALTDSDSPTLDDIIMFESSNSESDGQSIMEGHETHTREDSVTAGASLACSQSNSSGESELTETTSDSGCDGDDEESSAELTKIHTAAAAAGGGHSSSNWYDNMAQSSADELFEDEIQFQQILNGSFPLMSQQGQKLFNWKQPTTDKDSTTCNGGFKHPQLYGIQGRRGSRKSRKKPPPGSSRISTSHELCQRITEFVLVQTETELQLPMLSRSLCQTASKLAQIHHLEYVVTQQKRLLPVAAPLLKRTSLTQLASKDEVDKILRDSERSMTSPVLWSSSKRSKDKCVFPVRVPVSALCSHSRSAKETGKKTTPTPTTVVVGGDAPPIDDANIGNVMLRNIGWKPGNGLGAQENGIHNPLFASRRAKNTGLGYSQ